MQPTLISRRSLLLGLAALPLASHAAAPAAMLANVYHPDVPLADYWVSEKYDGVRGLWDGEQMWTRHGRRIQVPAWFTAGWPPMALDGELWAGRGRFTAAASATAKDAPDDAAWRGMRYMVFDAPELSGIFDERLMALRLRAKSLAPSTIQWVEQTRVADDADLQARLAQIVATGGEGLALHRGSSLYRGERSDALLKLKPQLDAEATVIGHVPGKGKYQGLMGALQLETAEGVRFRLGSGFSDAQRRDPPPIGSQVTFRYLGLHPGGAPRFASFLRVRPE